jgi:hypothetical protein
LNIMVKFMVSILQAEVEKRCPGILDLIRIL